MKFLAIRTRKRKDGKPRAIASVVHKNRKFGTVISEKSLSVRSPVLVTGAHSSGKSYWLQRLYKDAARIWSSCDGEPLILSSSRPLSAWVDDNKHLYLWWAGRDCSDSRHWDKLKATEKQDYLSVYLKETKSILFIDDAHNLTGRKLKVVQECIRSSAIWVMTATDEGRLNPSIRHDVLKKEPQIFRLDSEVAYDSTHIFLWVLIAAAISMGFWELAMILGGLQALSGGRRAAKQK
jgi:hypothetical protein